MLASEAPTERLWTTLDAARAALIQTDDVETWYTLTDVEKRRASSPPALTSLSVWQPPDEARARRKGLVPALFVRGKSSALDGPLVGLVGTRSASAYGRSTAAHFAARLSSAGCAVASGGALGVDATAHQAALEAGGQTVAVLPCGADVDYPARHRGLFAEIAGQGAVVSQFPPGTREQDHRLLARNRLLAGLVDALVLVEAPEVSGSLVTAHACQTAGTPLFVVPGPIGASFAGSHRLIREGARLSDDPAQVIEELGLSGARTEPDLAGVDGDEAVVLSVLEGVPLNPEKVAELAEVPVGRVLTALTMLELSGVVVRTSEGYARRP